MSEIFVEYRFSLSRQREGGRWGGGGGKGCVGRDGDCIMRRRKWLLLWRLYHSCTYV